MEQITRFKRHDDSATVHDPRVPRQWCFEDSSAETKKGLLQTIKRYWIRFGEFLGLIVGSILLGLVYILLVGIGRLTSVFMRLDLMRLRGGENGGYWRERPSTEQSFQSAKRTF